MNNMPFLTKDRGKSQSYLRVNTTKVQEVPVYIRREGLFYARMEHGNHMVEADANGFVVHWPSGAIRYPSARQTIMAVVNGVQSVTKGVKDPRVTFDSYFRNQNHPVEVDIASLFLKEATNRRMMDTSLSVFSPKKIKGNKNITVVDRSSTGLGIDLSKYHRDVRRLFFAGFSRRVVFLGYEPEDVLQEVYQGILVRNTGKCPFDPAKSSLGHYVHMVTGCILSNYNRKSSRIRRYESVGSIGEDGEIEDVALADLATVDPSQQEKVEMDSTIREIHGFIVDKCEERGLNPETGKTCFGLISDGNKKSEIMDILVASGAKEPGRVLKLVRNVVKEYRPYSDEE